MGAASDPLGGPDGRRNALENGRDYRVGYRLGLPQRGDLIFELGVDAQRRVMRVSGGAGNGLLWFLVRGFLVRATLGW